MKKIVSALVISSLLVACNNSSNGNENVKDSVIKTLDSTKDAKIDSLKDTTNKLKDKVENSFQKTDSANAANAKKDSTVKKK